MRFLTCIGVLFVILTVSSLAYADESVDWPLRYADFDIPYREVRPELYPPDFGDDGDVKSVVTSSVRVSGVPYFNQNDVAPMRFFERAGRLTAIGPVACGCTSLAMVLAYHAGVEQPADSWWQRTIHDCFRSTSLPGVGVAYPERFVQKMKREGLRGSAFVPFDSPDDRFILDTIVRLLQEKNPPILSLRGMGNGGHYVVVTELEINNNDPSTAYLTVHDSNGTWAVCEKKPATWCYNQQRGSGVDARYPWVEMAKKGGRLYIAR